MDKFRQMKDMLEEELKHLESKGDLNTGTLAQADTIAHTLKCLATYEAMEDKGGYSEHYPMYPYRGNSYDDGMSYARGRGRYAKRDSMGRYSSDDGRSYDNGESMDYGSRY
jgi:hypothetical protein